MRRCELTDPRLHDVAEMGRRLHLLDPRPRHRHVPRGTLLQEQLGGLDDGLDVEARPHHAVAEDVDERDQCHALMMRHVGGHHRHRLPFRYA